MRYAGITKNDLSAAPGVCVTLFLQGCPHRCPGCHNPETWQFDGGIERDINDLINELLDDLTDRNIHRDLCIMGGEPLCPENLPYTNTIISEIKKALPDTKIYIWTGYVYENLLKFNYQDLAEILVQTDVLIDGPYMKELRDITLPMRGSSNQRIIELT